MRTLLLAITVYTLPSYAFPVGVEVPYGSEQFELCWQAVPEAEQYAVYNSPAFIGSYVFANLVSGLSSTHSRPSLPGREFFYVVALDANNEVIESSDTVGCYYLRDFQFPEGRAKSVPFALGKLEYRVTGSSACSSFSADITTQPSSIIRNQAMPGGFTTADRVVTQNGGAFAYRVAPAGNWTGSLETTSAMALGQAFFFASIHDSPPPIITGCAQSGYAPAGTVSIASGVQAATPIGFPIVDAHHVGLMGLETCGLRRGTFTSADMVVEQISGRSAFILPNGNWRGTLDTCYPEYAYYIINRPHDNGAWTYDIATVGFP